METTKEFWESRASDATVIARGGGILFNAFRFEQSAGGSPGWPFPGSARRFITVLPLKLPFETRSLLTHSSISNSQSIMFTGLVETMAPVIEILDQPPGKRLTFQADAFFEDQTDTVQLGDSIAINGCCLTVVAIDGTKLAFEAGEETLSRTNLGRLVAGQSSVNLERSLPVGGRMGGHYVTGHIDAVGHLVERIDDPPWAFLRFELPSEYAVQVVGKGSIAIDGVSLTVVDVEANQFRVALIPHTLSVTTLGSLAEGDPVNLETDLLAKYVGRYLGQGKIVGSDANTAPWSEAVSQATSAVRGLSNG